MTPTNWDDRFRKLAEHVASWSKDPSTKVGAVLTDGKYVLSIGYNGFPIDIEDSEQNLQDREFKLGHILHAEINAINTYVKQTGRDPMNATLYTWPHPPCYECAIVLINRCIGRIICPNEFPDRWAKNYKAAQARFLEAGLEANYI